MLLEAEQKKLDGWYNKTRKDYLLWLAFQRLRSSFKCLHLSPRYRPAQTNTFMVQDISTGLSLYFTAVRYQTLSFFCGDSFSVSCKEQQQIYLEPWQSATPGWASEGARRIHFPRKCSVCLSGRDGPGRVTTSLLKNVYRPPVLAEPSPFGFVERISGSCCLEVSNAAYVWLTRMVFPTWKSLPRHAETSASGQQQERPGMHQDFQLGYFYHCWIKSAEAESFWIIQSLQLGVCESPIC